MSVRPEIGLGGVCFVLVMFVGWAVQRPAPHIVEPTVFESEMAAQDDRVRLTTIATATTPAEMRDALDWFRDATVDDVPLLRAAALGSEDALIAGRSIRTLARLAALPSMDELTRLLDDERSRVRREVVRALGRSDDARAVDLLASVLRGEEPTLRALAIDSLGRIRSSKARRALETARERAELGAVERVFLRDALAQHE